MLISAKLRGSWLLKGIFSKTTYVCVLSTKFQVSSIILTSFRQGVILSSPTSKRTPKKPTQFQIGDQNGLQNPCERDVGILNLIDATSNQYLTINNIYSHILRTIKHHALPAIFRSPPTTVHIWLTNTNNFHYHSSSPSTTYNSFIIELLFFFAFSRSVLIRY